MTELDDPVRLVKKGNPLAQRPVLAVGVLCGVLLVVGIAMGREGARETNQDEADEVSDAALAPAGAGPLRAAAFGAGALREP